MKTDANIRVDVENELRWDPSVDEKKAFSSRWTTVW